MNKSSTKPKNKSRIKKKNSNRIKNNDTKTKSKNYLPHTIFIITAFLIPFANQFAFFFMSIFPALTIILSIMSLQGSDVTNLLIIIYLIFLAIFVYQQTKVYKKGVKDQ